MQLDSPTCTTVYESQPARTHLMPCPTTMLPTLAMDIYIHLNNQVAIQACTKHPYMQPAQHHLLRIHITLATFQMTHPNTCFHLNWIPGHEGIPRNEKADKIAKQATNNTTEGLDTPSCIGSSGPPVCMHALHLSPQTPTKQQPPLQNVRQDNEQIHHHHANQTTTRPM